jgi:hypothetical protein
MREHESTCPICNGALDQRDLVGAISLRSTLFASPMSSDLPSAEVSPAICQFHGESSGTDWTFQSSTVPVLSQL